MRENPGLRAATVFGLADGDEVRFISENALKVDGYVWAKIEALEAAGAIIAPSAADMGTTMRKALGGR